jgi:hypothetical protein
MPLNEGFSLQVIAETGVEKMFLSLGKMGESSEAAGKWVLSAEDDSGNVVAKGG